jgi:hypothetical protein
MLDLQEDALADPPFRTEPYEAEREVLLREIRSGAAPGRLAFEATPAALARIRRTKTASLSRVLSWAYHPDERVPLALAARERAPWAPQHDKVVARALLYRALADANRAGEVWTPLLDALGRERLGVRWPQPYEDFAGWGETPEEYGGLPGVALGQGPPIERDEERAGRLVHWIGQQSDPAVLLPLLTRFEAKRVHLELARHARAFDDALAAAVLGCGLGPVCAMLSNPHLGDSYRERIEQWASTVVARAAGMADMADLGAEEPVFDRASGRSTVVAHEVLSHLRRGGHSLSPRSRALLKHGLQGRPAEEGQRALARRQADREAVWTHLQGAEPPLSAGELIEIYPGVQHERTFVEALIAHPSAGVELWRRVALETQLLSAREGVAAIAEARQDPVIRAALRRS